MFLSLEPRLFIINSVVGFTPFLNPAFVFGPMYIGLEYYLDKRGGGNVAHDAHYWGALFGFIFPIVLKPNLIDSFLSQIIG